MSFRNGRKRCVAHALVYLIRIDRPRKLSDRRDANVLTWVPAFRQHQACGLRRPKPITLGHYRSERTFAVDDSNAQPDASARNDLFRVHQIHNLRVSRKFLIGQLESKTHQTPHKKVAARGGRKLRGISSMPTQPRIKVRDKSLALLLTFHP
jgi:hypothetical protein